MRNRKNTLRLLVPCLLGVGAASVAAQQAPVALPQGVRFVTSVEGINEYHLPNGLRVLLFPDPTKSNITVNVTYMVGSRHEDYGETGMAHLLEHLLFKGSTNHTAIPKELQDHGARPNGTTWVDRTNYYETFQASDENLKWALSLESDRMVNSFIAKKDLDSEMTVVRNEMESGENNPQNVLMARIVSTAYLWHNYGKSTIGARSDVENVPIERLQAFYHHFYQPDNAVLVVAGKFDEAKTLALVTQFFGPIPKPTRLLRVTYTVEPAQDGERGVTLRRVGDVQAIGIAYHVPAGTSEEFTGIDLAADMLGETPSGRLYKALVETKKAATVAAFAFQNKEPGVLLALATVRTENSLDDALTTMISVFDEIKMKPFTQEELDRVRTQGLKNFDLMMNNSEQVALVLSEWQAMGDWRTMFLQRDRVRKAKLADVQKAADKYFVASNRTIGKFIPDKTPVRAEVPPVPDVDALVKDYKGDPLVSKGEEFDASPENIDKRTIRGDLKGGLKLSFINKKTRGEQVTALIQLHWGDEKTLMNQTTAASLAGQMLMRGTPKHTREQIKDEFDKLKAQVSISGSPTGATASIQTTRPNLNAVLDLAAEVLKEASFPDKEFDQLKQQQLAGLENQKSEPQAIAFRAAQRHMNPYPPGDVRHTNTLDEDIAKINAVTLDEVKAFHHNFYGASNGEVTIIGDFDPETTQKQVSTLFNDWKSPKPFTDVPDPDVKLEAKQETFETPDKANAMWVTGERFPMSDTDPDYPALLMANYIFGGSGINSRLFARIRGKEGLSYGVGSQLAAPIKDDGAVFMAFAICAPQNAPKVEASFKDELNQVIANGFTAEELDAAKKSWLQSRQVSRAQDRELAGRIANERFHDRTMAFDAELEKKVMALSPAQLQTAFKKYVDPAHLSFFRAGDFKKANVTW
jgi:zinc protease